MKPCVQQAELKCIEPVISISSVYLQVQVFSKSKFYVFSLRCTVVFNEPCLLRVIDKLEAYHKVSQQLLLTIIMYTMGAAIKFSRKSSDENCMPVQYFLAYCIICSF